MESHPPAEGEGDGEGEREGGKWGRRERGREMGRERGREGNGEGGRGGGREMGREGEREGGRGEEGSQIKDFRGQNAAHEWKQIKSDTLASMEVVTSILNCQALD